MVVVGTAEGIDRAAGLLSPKIGGPSVFPPLPPSIAELTYNSSFQWKTSTGEDRYRRGMYIYFWRSSPDPFLMTFDAPNANVTCTRRVRSNTPLQSLTMANDQAMVEMAQALARRLLSFECDDDRQRIHNAFRLCFSRSPDDVEWSRLTEYLDGQRGVYAGAPDQAARCRIARSRSHGGQPGKQQHNRQGHKPPH